MNTCSLTVKYALMGSTCEMDVSVEVWADEIADLNTCDAGDSSHQRRDFRELKVQLGLLDVRLCRQDRCLGATLHLNFGIELALRDCARFGQRRVALDIEAGLAELCLGLRQLRVRLIERRLQRPRIDLKEHVALPYDGTFPVVLFDDVPGDSRLNLRVHVSVERGHPVAVDRGVALNDRGDFHSGRSRGPTLLWSPRSHPRSGGRQRPAPRGRPVDRGSEGHEKGLLRPGLSRKLMCRGPGIGPWLLRRTPER